MCKIVRIALAGLAVVLAMPATSPVLAQTCNFNLDIDPAVLTPDTFRFCVGQANTTGTDTVNSQLASASTVFLTEGTVAVTSSMTIDGDNPYTLFSGTATVLSLSGGHTLTIRPNVTIRTTGIGNFGIDILNADNSVILEGQIETEGDSAHGIVALSGGNEINVTESGSIETQGPSAIGIFAAGGDNTIVVSGSVETDGGGADAIRVVDANNTIEISSSGTIDTKGNAAHGIFQQGPDSTIDVSGSIETGGNQARGIWAQGGNNEIDVSGSIDTEGLNAHGVQASDGDNVVNVSGSIHTTGGDAYGILTQGGNNEINVSESGSISTEGIQAHAIVAQHGNSKIDVAGTIETTRDDTFGIVAESGNNSVDLSGSIVTTGAYAYGILVNGGDNEIDVSGSIETEGNNAHGIFAGNGDNTVIVSGSISATGAGANAILFDGAGGNRLELQPGYSITGDVVGFGGDTLTLGGEGDDSFDSDLIGTQYTGFAEFEKRGGSTWTLLGVGGQDWTVFDGTFLVAGSAGFIDVTGGTLGGNGTVAGFIARSGSTISPGASIGTLNVTGDGEFEAGSVYLVELDADGNSDLLAVDGVVIISSEAALHLVPAAGLYGLGDDWLIITAAGGFVGQFGIIEGLDLAFLKPRIEVDGNEMRVELVLKTEPDDPTDPDALGKLFQTAAVTANQSATGYAIGASGIGDPLFDLVVGYTVGQARHAFDALSGEIYATLAADLRRSARRFVAAVLRGAGSAAGTGEAASGRDLAGRDLWVRSWGSWDRQSGDGNGARATTDRFGAAAGIEAELAPGVRLGAAGGYRNDSLTVAERSSDADVDTLDLAGYGRVHFERLRLTGGVAAAFHRIEATRDILIPGLAVQARSSPNATSLQAFAEAAYGVDVGPAVVAPFASVTWGRTRLHGFAERGAGIAGLISTGAAASAVETALGVRVSGTVAVGHVVLRPQAAVAWEHAFSDLTGRATHRFAGSPLFTVHGPARPRDRLALAGGLEADLSEAFTAHLGYEASLASGSHSHGVMGGIRLGF